MDTEQGNDLINALSESISSSAAPHDTKLSHALSFDPLNVKGLGTSMPSSSFNTNLSNISGLSQISATGPIPSDISDVSGDEKDEKEFNPELLKKLANM